MWICYVRCLRYRLPPSKHSPPSPVGHGRGLVSRSGCAVPGEGVVSPSLRPASPTPERTGETPQRTCRLPGSQPLLALARDSLCLPPVVPYRLRRVRRAANHFCQYAGPSDNRALCKVAEPCRPCASTLRYRFAYGYIMQAIIRRASWWRQFTKGSRCAFASVGFGQVRPFLACLAASLSAPRFS